MSGVRTTAWVATPLLAVFGLVDVLVVPRAVLLAIAIVRGVGVLVVLGIVAIMSTSFGERRAHAMGLVLITVCSALLTVFILASGGAMSPYYVGLGLVLMGVAVLIPWRPSWSLAASVVPVACYGLIVAIDSGPGKDIARITVAFALLASMGFIAVASSILGERLRLREFASRTELRESEERFRTLAAHAPIGIYENDANGVCTYTNAYWQRISGFAAEETLGDGWKVIVHPDDLAACSERWERAQRERCELDSDFRIRRPDGQVRWVQSSTTPVLANDGRLLGYVGTAQDVTDRKRSEQDLQQAQKLEAVGQLAAGIAHEINTPIQFVGDNTRFLQDAFGDLQTALRAYETVVVAAETGPVAEAAVRAARDAAAAADVSYLEEEIPKALAQALDGVTRVATIVRAMKDFAHTGGSSKAPVDLNHALASTLTVAQNEIKYVADVETDFGTVPLVECHAGEINQVLLNLLVNAAHAIGDVVRGGGARGKIRVRTRRDGDTVVIAIADTGTGIPEAVRAKVFDPFFTTKEVGRGTGQGLAIARTIVVEKHGGSVTFETEAGRGTTFFIRLPIGGGAADGADTVSLPA